MKLAVKIAKRQDGAFDLTLHPAENTTGELGSALCGCRIQRGALRRLLPDPADTFGAFAHGMHAKTFFWPDEDAAEPAAEPAEETPVESIEDWTDG